MRSANERMRVLRYLVCFCQTGLTVVLPPVLFCYGAIWLRNRFGWGNCVVLAGLLFGLAVAARDLWNFLRFTERKAGESEKERKRKP